MIHCSRMELCGIKKKEGGMNLIELNKCGWHLQEGTQRYYCALTRGYVSIVKKEVEASDKDK